MSSTVRIQYNKDDFPVTYECTSVVQNNLVTPVEINFYYDLVFGDSLGLEAAQEFVESSLLIKIASEYGLADGSACQSPPNSGIWLVQASSLPEDSLHSESCYQLSPVEAGETCVSLQGIMTGYVIGPDDISETIDFVAKQLNSGAVTAGSQFRAKFIATQIEDQGGRDELPDAINAENDYTQPSSSDKGKWSILGVLLLVGLAVAFLGLAFVVIRRRRRSRISRAREAQKAIDRAHFDHEESSQDLSSFEAPKASAKPDRDTALLDEESSAPPEFPSTEFCPNFPDMTSSFDVGAAMKSELLGVHGGAAAVVTPNSRNSKVADTSSDSDADSWAQADGSLGSLELSLEPITAEV